MKVAFVGAFAGQMTERVRAELAIPCELIADDEERIIPRLGDVDVIVGMVFSRAMAEAAPRLRLVQVPGAGLDRVDRRALRPETRLANAYGHDAGIAEFAIGAMIALSRSFNRLDAALRKGQWAGQWLIGQPPEPLWPELAGKTLGILGFGHIGQALARRAAAFDMRICAIRQRARTGPLPERVARLGGPDQIDDVLREADHLAVTLPLSAATRGLIDARRLALMKPTAYIVNVARGEIIDEAALYRALADKRLAGAALDVWYRYPSAAGPTMPAAQPFHELPNVLLTPHISGWTEGMLASRVRLIADNIARTARGEPPLNLIAPAP